MFQFNIANKFHEVKEIAVKKVLKILGAVAALIAVLMAAILMLLIWASKQPAVRENYFDNVQTNAELENKYKGKGVYAVSTAEYDMENTACKKVEIWYPSQMTETSARYPLVIMANGTGVPAAKYRPIFEHLASWGFLVVGNEDESSWSGKSSAESLDFILKLNQTQSSVFYGKVDIDHIGIAGHSQGGVGAINAVTNQENGGSYRAMYTASDTHVVLAEALNWTYDVYKVNIPYFMVAGTEKTDAGDGIDGSNNVGIAPLFSLQENYEKISNGSVKFMARRSHADHGDMLAIADSYMTAWFLYWLKGDVQAQSVFFGENAEILNNGNWQDVTCNLPSA